MRSGLAGELMEIERLTVWDEIFVGDVVVRLEAGKRPFGSQGAGIEGIGVNERPDETVQGLARVGKVAQGIAERAAQVPAGIGVVADIGDSVGCHAMAGYGEHAGANGLRDPGVDAVGDDVVEAGRGALEVSNGEAVELDVAGADGGGDFVSAADVNGVVIDAGEMAGGERLTHGQEVEAGAAAEFEDAAIFDRGRF
jgi:hypothetical protein